MRSIARMNFSRVYIRERILGGIIEGKLPCFSFFFLGSGVSYRFLEVRCK